MVLDTQVSTLRHLTLGFAGTLTRQRVGDVTWDPNREALSAEAARPRVFVPKFFAQWDTDQYSILAGTYRAGFGQRLTFDNTRNPTPNGLYRDLTIYPRPVSCSSRDGIDRNTAGPPVPISRVKSQRRSASLSVGRMPIDRMRSSALISLRSGLSVSARTPPSSDHCTPSSTRPVSCGRGAMP